MWWEYLVVGAVFALGLFGFLNVVGFQTRWLSRRTARTAENMYPDFEDRSTRRRRARRGDDPDPH